MHEFNENPNKESYFHSYISAVKNLKNITGNGFIKLIKLH